MSWRKTGKKGYPVGKGLKVKGSAAEETLLQEIDPSFLHFADLQGCNKRM